MIYINILLIAVIITIVTDNLYFLEEILEKPLSKWLNLKEIHIKIFECSTCQIWWVSLLYLIINNAVNIPNITYALVIAYFSDVINDIINMVKSIIIKLIHL